MTSLALHFKHHYIGGLNVPNEGIPAVSSEKQKAFSSTTPTPTVDLFSPHPPTPPHTTPEPKKNVNLRTFATPDVSPGMKGPADGRRGLALVHAIRGLDDDRH